MAPKIVAGAWVGGEDQSVHLLARGEGSVVALPIVGDFLKRVYDDPRLGINRTDRFVRPAMMPHYDCDEELTTSSGGELGDEEEDEMFFN